MLSDDDGDDAHARAYAPSLYNLFRGDLVPLFPLSRLSLPCPLSVPSALPSYLYV